MILQANRGYRTRLGMVLSYKPFVFMGLISYSLYLWHWPVLVLTKLTLNAPPTSVQKAAMLLVMVALAIVSWRFVERPFRRSRERTGRTRLFATAATIIILFSGFGLLAKVTQGSPDRFSGPLRSLAVADQDVSHYRDKCDRPSLDRIHRGDICIIGSPGKPATVALFGDSHADALIPGLEAAAIASGTGMSLYSRTGCHPLFGADWCSGSKARLTQLDAMAAAVVADPQIRSVIMIGRWPELAESSRYGSDDKPNAAFLKDDQTKVGGHAENLRVLDRSFGRMMAALPGKHVFVVLGIPEQRIDVPQIVFSRKQLGLSEPTGITRAEYDARQRDARATLVNASKKYGFTLIDLSETACDTHYCPVVKGGKPLYFDDHHLSGAGALRFKTLLERAFYSGNSAVSQPPLPQPQIAAPTSVKL